MAGENKLFLKALRKSWKQKFPFLVPVDLEEVPKVQKGCNFRCDKYLANRGVCYFFTIDFQPKTRGRFILRISTSSNPEKSIVEHGDWPLTAAKPTGMFGVWQILERRYLAWDLVDWAGELNQLYTQLGMDYRVEPGDSPDIWRPVSYAVPIEAIVDAAIEDLNAVMMKEVFPRLEIEA